MTKGEATAQLHKAIQDHAQAFDLQKPGELLSEFAIIVAWTNVEANGKTWYTTHYHADNVPQHVSTGLFNTGLILAEDQGNED